jgi:hypothetical protein
MGQLLASSLERWTHESGGFPTLMRGNGLAALVLLGSSQCHAQDLSSSSNLCTFQVYCAKYARYSFVVLMLPYHPDLKCLFSPQSNVGGVLLVPLQQMSQIPAAFSAVCKITSSLLPHQVPSHSLAALASTAPPRQLVLGPCREGLPVM